MKLDGVNMDTTEPTEAVAEPSTQENASEQASPQPEDTADEAGSNDLASVSPLCKGGTKLDGVSMTATEPSGVAEPSPTQENQSERAAPPPEDAAPGVDPKANSRPVATVEPKCISKKPTAKSVASSGTNSRAAAAAAASASHRPVNDVRVPNNVSALAVRKTAGANAKPAAAGAGAVPKRPVGAAAASSSVRSQTRVPDKRPVGQARTTSATSAAANGTKPTSANSTARKKTGPEAVGGARPKNPGKSPREECNSHEIPQKYSRQSFVSLIFAILRLQVLPADLWRTLPQNPPPPPHQGLVRLSFRRPPGMSGFHKLTWWIRLGFLPNVWFR